MKKKVNQQASSTFNFLYHPLLRLQKVKINPRSGNSKWLEPNVTKQNEALTRLMNIFWVLLSFHSVLASNSTLNSEKNKPNWNWTQTINSKLSKQKEKEKKRSAELLQLCHDDRSWWNVSNSWLLLTMSSWATWLLFVERVVKVSRCRRKWGKRGFTTGWDEGEVLVLASFSLAVADVEVDVDWSGQPLVPVRGNLDQEAVLQQRQVILLNHYTKTINYHNCITLYSAISILVSYKFLLSL